MVGTKWHSKHGRVAYLGGDGVEVEDQTSSDLTVPQAQG